jgi:hypothetical protein
MGHGRGVYRSTIVSPLVLDETLANRDDGRAHAIMEALLEFAADGRQVFYLTAQPGEVERFRKRVRESLETYLEENDYLDRRERLEPTAIRARTLAAVAGDLARGFVDVDRVDRLLARVEAGLSEPARPVPA